MIGGLRGGLNLLGHTPAKASDTLRADREVVKAACSAFGQQLEWASPDLKRDREIVTMAVATSWRALGFADPELQADRDIVLAAVRHSGMALEYASPELLADREMVLAAVRNSNGCNFLFRVPDELKVGSGNVRLLTCHLLKFGVCGGRRTQFPGPLTSTGRPQFRDPPSRALTKFGD